MTNYENIQWSMPQSFPMKMMLREDMNSERGTFIAKFSRDDFFCDNDEVPLCILLEVLGQAAEYFLRIQGECEKKYLVQVNEFKICESFSDKLYLPFVLRVEIIQKFGKMIKSHVTMHCNEVMVCEGCFMHANAE